MQSQCAEVLEFEVHASCQCRDGLDNEGRSIYLHQSLRIATDLHESGISDLECIPGSEEYNFGNFHAMWDSVGTSHHK